MKKIVLVFALLLTTLLLGGCTKEKENEKQENIEGSLVEIMSKLYEGIAEDDLPMMLDNIELNEENFLQYAFVEVDYKEAIASESMVGSIPHSVVLIRLNDEADVEKTVKDLKENANPRKWVCVESENTYVLSKGNLVVLIMSNDLAPTIKENFENLS